jgi:hypothetical protein
LAFQKKTLPLCAAVMQRSSAVLDASQPHAGITEFLNDEEMVALLKALPPSEFAFAYGSGALRQEVSCSRRRSNARKPELTAASFAVFAGLCTSFYSSSIAYA